MNALYEWGIPSLAFVVWAVLILTLIPPIIRRFKRKAEQTRYTFDEALVSTVGTPLMPFFLALGLSFYIDAIPPLSKKRIKYTDASLIILFVLSGYLFVDRLMMEVLRRYSKKMDVISSSAGVISI